VRIPHTSARKNTCRYCTAAPSKEADVASVSGAPGISCARQGVMTGILEEEEEDTITVLMYDFKTKVGN
jgi:hypothetical protein